MSNAKQILAAIESGDIANVLSTPLSTEEINALVERAKTDPGAPFESGVIARVAATKRANLAEFMRLRARLKDAKISLGELDKALAEGESSREDGGGQGRAITFPKIELWPKPVDGAALLSEIVAHLERHVMMPHEAAIATALWIIHAYCFDAFMISPRLVITSPEKRCGKTTLLRVIQALVPKPLFAANITPAAMFRTIETYRPTLLIDEADAFLRDNEELRGIINSGHECNGSVIRLTGEDFEPSAFSTFCPTVIAAIGSLPATIEDRAIMIAMRRRLASETIVRFRSDRAGHLGELARKVARWVADHEYGLRGADPDMPEALHDRACDNWRGCFAITDLVGGTWPQKARGAALTLASQGSEEDDQSRGVMLLADIRRVFDDRQKRGSKDADRISSTDLVTALTMLTDRPWATWSRGKPVTAVAVARLLKSFRIVPNTIKLSDGKQPNGYKRSQFDDALGRYLSNSPDSATQSSPPSPTPIKTCTYEQIQGSPQGWRGERPKRVQPVDIYSIGEDGELSNPKTGEWEESGHLENPDEAWLKEFLFSVGKKSKQITATT
jgi:hypothetical protein